ncbi:hypothetical protein Taro_041605 [Colocasia esculenta]|uniref:Uncharacterized protein n=1 Tax=Colocasia esculenta TaxID=4460 RepID=A0A843WM59_COLES|nr:hypothetical protein [Colocasia esculenta]
MAAGVGKATLSRLAVVVMADRRDWGGGGDDPEESTQRMIERIWESLTEIQMRMDHQVERTRVLLGQEEELWRFQLGIGIFGVSSLQGVWEKRGKREGEEEVSLLSSSSEP